MSQTPLLGTAAVSPIPTTAAQIGVVPPSPLTSTDLQALVDEIQAEVGSFSGAFLTVVNGGGGTVQAHGNLGSTETINTANGNYHWGTLNADCTFTFTTIVDTAERWFTLELIEDGTGGWQPTWPISVVWLGGTAPTHDDTAGTTTIYAFFTRNGGTTWIGGELGASAVTSVGLSMPAEFTVTGSPVTTTGTLTATKANQNANLVYAGPASGAAAAPTFRALVVADIPSGLPGAVDHEHIMDVLMSGDGSTVAFELPAAPFDAYSVAAYVSGTLTEVTLSGALLTTATFGSAPASATDNIRFDIVAAVA